MIPSKWIVLWCLVSPGHRIVQVEKINDQSFAVFEAEETASVKTYRFDPDTGSFKIDSSVSLPLVEPFSHDVTMPLGGLSVAPTYAFLGRRGTTSLFYDADSKQVFECQDGLDTISRSYVNASPPLLKRVSLEEDFEVWMAEMVLPTKGVQGDMSHFVIKERTGEIIRCVGKGLSFKETFMEGLLPKCTRAGMVGYIYYKNGEVYRYSLETGESLGMIRTNQENVSLVKKGNQTVSTSGDRLVLCTFGKNESSFYYLEKDTWMFLGRFPRETRAGFAMAQHMVFLGVDHHIYFEPLVF